MTKYILEFSDRPKKRFTLEMPEEGHEHHFGAKPFKKGTYIDHGSDKLKKAWIARHKGDKNWNNLHSGIFFARHLLWNKPTLKESIRDLQKKKGIKIQNKTGLQ